MSSQQMLTTKSTAPLFGHQRSAKFETPAFK